MSAVSLSRATLESQEITIDSEKLLNSVEEDCS